MMRNIGMNSELDDEWIFCNFGHSGISQQRTGKQYADMLPGITISEQKRNHSRRGGSVSSKHRCFTWAQ
jgi:hypothetical protein